MSPSRQQPSESVAAAAEQSMRTFHGSRVSRQLIGSPQVITGETFRTQILGWSKRPFYALVKSGRVQHLRAVNLCTARRTFYVRSKVEAWIAESPVSVRRVSQSQKAR